MLIRAAPSVQCLRQPPGPPRDSPAATSVTEATGERAPKEDIHILCRTCLHPITRPAERISVQGRHTHTFANPHGIVFEIGCFQRAPGGGLIGPASNEFTWFTGYRWRVCVCAACLNHLGWAFLPPANGAFFGLILDRLIEPSP